MIAATLSDDPITYEQATSGPQKQQWIDAMTQEMESLIKTGTFRLVKLPAGRKPIGCKWIYKTKKDENGNVVRFKVRQVAQGFSQKHGIDFHETFAPVARLNTIRIGHRECFELWGFF